MRIQVLGRVIKDQVQGKSLRECYWKVGQNGRRLARLLRSHNRAFAELVLADFISFLFDTIKPEANATVERAHAASRWLLQAQGRAGDGGVPLGYFPCDEDWGWRRSYPETTGYIITSLLAFSRQCRDERAVDAALGMARWEISIQMRHGAVQGGPACPAAEQTPCAFNTGMVLDGWISAYQLSQDSRFLEAARRAGDWLVADLGDDGYFRTNGQFVTAGAIKTYNCLCAWSLYRLGELLPAGGYQAAAIRSVEAALRQQQPNGWFANNCLTRPEAPLVHTIAYTVQGILEVGISAGRADFVRCCQSTVEALLARTSKRGFLPGRFYSDWEPACFSSCLTGSAQLAVICYRLFEHLGDAHYRLGARRLLDYLKALQPMDSPEPSLNGALGGSFPLFGGYMTAGYPNWATKYLLDALLLQDRLDG